MDKLLKVQYPKVKLCYLVVDLMDQTVGRFLGPADEDYDPGYDTLRNEVLTDHEVFQLLYSQLLLRYLFDYTVQDLMLHGQLRGDNLGLRCVRKVSSAPGGGGQDALWYEAPSLGGPDNNSKGFLCFPLHPPKPNSFDQKVCIISFH